MSNIRNWSTTPDSNTSAPPYGAPEGMLPSTVNNIIRQQMADHKNQWQDAEWFDRGDTPSYASSTTFKVTTDVTTRYLVGRRIKLYDASTLYASITLSNYSAPDTTVTIALDSGAMSASLSSIALSILSPTSSSIPVMPNLTVAGTSSLSGATVLKTTLSVEGNTTLSGAVTFKTAITSPTFITPALGTPSSGVLTSCTGTASGLTAGNVTTNANLTGPITSVGNATSVAAQTGTGSTFVMQASPTLTTPALGTPGSGTLTSCTGLPISSGVSGLGTGIATALGVNTGSAGAPVLFNGAGGTPSSLTGTNISGTAASLTSGNVTTNANLTGHVTSVGNAAVLGSFTSAQLATALTDETGSGALVFGTSPTLVTPLLGTPTSGVLTNCTGTASGFTAGNVTTNANLTGHVTSVGNAAVLGSFTSAQLATALTDETGSGAAVFATSPTFTTPLLGTPTSGTLTNCTGYTDANLSTSDVTTNNATTSKHGFLLKLNNSSTSFMNGTGAWSTPSGAGDALVANPLSQFAATTSLQLAGVISDETGSGALAFATSPTLVTPLLGTPTSGTLTNCTGYTGANLVCSATNDDASSTKLGEFISSTLLVASAVTLSTGAAKTVTSVSLTAGDWDVHGNVSFTDGTATSITVTIGSISTTDNTLPATSTVGAYFHDRTSAFVPAVGSGLIWKTRPTGEVRLSLSGTTTVYLVAYSEFTVSGQKACGFIGARRSR